MNYRNVLLRSTLALAALAVELSTISLSHGAPLYPKEEVIETLRDCCFRDENKKLVLFKEPISVLFYDLTDLGDSVVELLDVPIDLINNRSDIDITFKDLKKSEYERLGSNVFIIVLPASQSSIPTKDRLNIERLYDEFIRSSISPSKISANETDFQAILDKLYRKNMLDMFYSRAKSITLWSTSSDALRSSMYFIKIPDRGLFVPKTIAQLVLSSLGYNREAKELKHSIFSKFEGSNEYHEADEASFTELDFLILRILYGNKNQHIISFKEAVDRIP